MSRFLSEKNGMTADPGDAVLPLESRIGKVPQGSVTDPETVRRIVINQEVRPALLGLIL